MTVERLWCVLVCVCVGFVAKAPDPAVLSWWVWHPVEGEVCSTGRELDGGVPGSSDSVTGWQTAG